MVQLVDRTILMNTGNSDFSKKVSQTFSEYHAQLAGLHLRLEIIEKAQKDLEKEMRRVEKELESLENTTSQDRHILRGVGLGSGIIIALITFFFPLYLTIKIQEGIDKEMFRFFPNLEKKIQPMTPPSQK